MCKMAKNKTSNFYVLVIWQIVKKYCWTYWTGNLSSWFDLTFGLYFLNNLLFLAWISSWMSITGCSTLHFSCCESSYLHSNAVRLFTVHLSYFPSHSLTLFLCCFPSAFPLFHVPFLTQCLSFLLSLPRSLHLASLSFLLFPLKC